MVGKTSFKAWREHMGLTQQQAADALGVSLSQIKNYDAGFDRGRNTPSVPPRQMRILMKLLTRKEKVVPWPE
jgi:transcriptional regulator with XRE-family HTH domain